ncbi:MAG: penicillin-binding protein 2 [Patescibacteria group bacterium]
MTGEQTHKSTPFRERRFSGAERFRPLQLIVVLVSAIIVLRLAQVQIIQFNFYNALASGQRDLYLELFPERGEIFVKDKDGTEAPLATNIFLNFVWAEPRKVENAEGVAETLSDLLGYEKKDEGTEEGELDKSELLLQKLKKENDPYEPIEHRVSDDVADIIRAANLAGIHIADERIRYYPESESSAHITGFVSADDKGVFIGKYGLEGFLDDELAGKGGYVFSERDAKGRWISIGLKNLRPAEDGVDLLLTIDRAVQFQACGALKNGVKKAEADSGSVIILDPKTGAILAMCGYPTFDPNNYGSVDSIADYNNQAIFGAYEAGSVVKPLAMAGAIDVGAVSPNTTFEDVGEVKVDRFTIRNAGLKSYGQQTMTGVLVHSINTGMVFVTRKLGAEQMGRVLKRFGLGQKTGVPLDSEVSGDVSSLDKGHEVYAATAAFGQGMTITPIQLAAAYSALANGGTMFRPYLIAEKRYADGSIWRAEKETVGQIVSEKTAQLVSAMLVSVVEEAYKKSIAIPGYYIAGKTGTAQVPKGNGAGYKEDDTKGTFVGYFPAQNPQFVVLVRVDHPRTTQWAEGSAGPIFKEIARFLIQYSGIPPEK